MDSDFRHFVLTVIDDHGNELVRCLLMESEQWGAELASYIKDGKVFLHLAEEVRTIKPV
jgi:hypothetical protein